MQENKIQAKIIKYMTLEGCYCIKIVTATKAGVSDTIFCYQGYFISIEVKTETGKLSRLQEHNIVQVQDARGVALVVYGYDDFVFKIAEVLAELSKR